MPKQNFPRRPRSYHHNHHHHRTSEAKKSSVSCPGQRFVLAIGLSTLSICITRKCYVCYWRKRSSSQVLSNRKSQDQFPAQKFTWQRQNQRSLFFAGAVPLHWNKDFSHFVRGGTSNLYQRKKNNKQLSRQTFSSCSDGSTTDAKVGSCCKLREGNIQSPERHISPADMNESESHTDVIGGGAINEKNRGGIELCLNHETASNASTEINQRHCASSDNAFSAISPQAFDPCHNVSHLLHSIVGLDRYPNYLSRWTQEGGDHDIDELERALEEQLSKVRQQRMESHKRRSDIEVLVREVVESLNLSDESGKDLTNVQESNALPFPIRPPRNWDELKEKVLHPDAVKHIFRSRCFNKQNGTRSNQNMNGQGVYERSEAGPFELGQVLKGNARIDLDPGQLQGWMDEELYDVYSFPLLSPSFCEMLRKIVRAIAEASTKESKYQDLKLGNRPVNLDLIGMGWLNDLLFYLIMKPITRHLYQTQECGNEDLDWRHGYIAGYSAKAAAETATPRNRLVPHTDDSEVTLNICVGDEFEGGALQFSGLRGTADEGKVHSEDESRFQPRLGTALLHAGRHLHEVTPVTNGDRYALIVWARSWKGIRAQTCPCCWLNRRMDQVCVCGPAWN